MPKKIPAMFVFLLLLASILACMSGTGGGDRAALRGVDAYEAGEYEVAVQELQQALEQGVSDYKPEEVQTILGNTYLELDRYGEAIAAHEKALELNPEFYKAWVNLGVVYRHTGDFDRAEEAYRKALVLNPDYAELYASLGALYIFKGEIEPAVETLEKSVALDPQLATAHGNLALAYAMAGRFDEAEASLKQATALGYKNWETIQERIENLEALQE